VASITRTTAWASPAHTRPDRRPIPRTACRRGRGSSPPAAAVVADSSWSPAPGRTRAGLGKPIGDSKVAGVGAGAAGPHAARSKAATISTWQYFAHRGLQVWAQPCPERERGILHPYSIGRADAACVAPTRLTVRAQHAGPLHDPPRCEILLQPGIGSTMRRRPRPGRSSPPHTPGIRSIGPFCLVGGDV